MQSPALLTAREAAAYLGICLASFRRLVRKSAFPKVAIDGRVRVRRADLDAFIARNVRG